MLENNSEKIMSKKNEKLNNLLKEMERKYSVHKASEIEVEPKIRTGLYALDYVLDGGISQYSGKQFTTG